MNFLDYLDKTQIVNIESSKDCTKEEILNYSEFLNKNHHKIMSNKEFKSDNDKMLKCHGCKFNKKMTKGYIETGTQIYTITCEKEMICFTANWNSHISDLPCYDGR